MKKFLLNFLRFLTLPEVITNKIKLYSSDFVAGENEFLLNGNPFIIRAGELHYNCIPKNNWDQRIKTAKGMGLNTICINLLWKTHEQDQGVFDFTGQKEVAEFIHMIQENEMYCILRPGPNAGNELDIGGLPGWLLKKTNLNILNHSDEFFIERLKIYLNEVAKQLASYQIQNGGPIIIVQMEDRYDMCKDNKNYMKIMGSTIRQVGFDKVQLMGYDWTALSSIKWKVIFEDSVEKINITNGLNMNLNFQE